MRNVTAVRKLVDVGKGGIAAAGRVPDFPLLPMIFI